MDGDGDSGVAIHPGVLPNKDRVVSVNKFDTKLITQ